MDIFLPYAVQHLSAQYGEFPDALSFEDCICNVHVGLLARRVVRTLYLFVIRIKCKELKAQRETSRLFTF
jgi:hypothetical protein